MLPTAEVCTSQRGEYIEGSHKIPFSLFRSSTFSRYMSIFWTPVATVGCDLSQKINFVFIDLAFLLMTLEKRMCYSPNTSSRRVLTVTCISILSIANHSTYKISHIVPFLLFNSDILSICIYVLDS